jgi:hypothetical protein
VCLNLSTSLWLNRPLWISALAGSVSSTCWNRSFLDVPRFHPEVFRAERLAP